MLKVGEAICDLEIDLETNHLLKVSLSFSVSTKKVQPKISIFSIMLYAVPCLLLAIAQIQYSSLFFFLFNQLLLSYENYAKLFLKSSLKVLH